jgi:hypothetical protein
MQDSKSDAVASPPFLCTSQELPFREIGELHADTDKCLEHASGLRTHLAVQRPPRHSHAAALMPLSCSAIVQKRSNCDIPYTMDIWIGFEPGFHGCRESRGRFQVISGYSIRQEAFHLDR